MCVTVATSTSTSWFAPKLRSALEQKNVSVRALARMWRPDGDPETSRRSLNRYLNKGIVPSPQIRRELSEALGIEQDELEPTDEEETDPMAALLKCLRAVVRHSIREEMRA